MTWFKHLGKVYELADQYVDNRLELAKAEVTGSVGKAINRAVTFGFIMFIGAIIYVLLLLMAIVLINEFTHSLLATYFIVLLFHVILLLIGLKVQKTWFRGFIEKFLSVEFTDIEEKEGDHKQVSLESYKTSLKNLNGRLVDDIKENLRSVFFIDQLTAFTNPSKILPEDDSQWSEDQRSAYSQFLEMVNEEFPSKPYSK